uniref:Cell division cycle protein 27 homolog n=1 Tax=Globodera pallida TaxID=36090 RepID=A0A183CEZ8_GLOPA
MTKSLFEGIALPGRSATSGVNPKDNVRNRTIKPPTVQDTSAGKSLTPHQKERRRAKPTDHQTMKALIKEVPEAIFCRSFLLSVGSLKFASPILTTKKANSEDDPSSIISEIAFTSEARMWAKTKQLEGQKRYLEAAQLLDNAATENLRLLLDQGRLYRIAGNPQKALDCYQRAHNLDCTNAEGMDAFAALLGTLRQFNERQAHRELDSLAHAMAQYNPRKSEAFTVYGWAARQCHRPQDAKQFALRAEQLARWRGRERAEALLLKAQLLADSKRVSKETELVVTDLLHNDPTMTPAYALCIQTSIAQKRFTDAKKMAKRAMDVVGRRNHQIILLYAQALADDNTANGSEMAIELLAKIVQDAPVSVDCLLLLARLYEKQQRFEQAISLLNRFKEASGR